MENVLIDWPKHSKTGRKTICFVGMAPTSRDKAPFDDKEVLIMGLNEEYNFDFLNRWDAWMQIHRAWDALREYNFNHPNHPYWITNTSGPCMLCEGAARPDCKDCKGSGVYEPHRREDFPVFVSDEDLLDIVPGAIMYPKAEIVERFGLDEHDHWFTSTLAYQIALALYYGFEEIQIWGFEMSSGTEYAAQKSCAAFWLGLAKGLGVKRVLPDECGLLGYFDRLYAYENVPGLYTLQHAEIDVTNAKREVDNALKDLNMIRGEKGKLAQKLNIKSIGKGMRTKIAQEMALLNEREVNALGKLNAHSGYLQHAQNVQKRLKGHPAPRIIKHFSDMKFKVVDTHTGEVLVDDEFDAFEGPRIQL